MDLRRLREETRPEHEATEAQMPLMGEVLSPELYRAVLGRILPVLLAWESWAGSEAPEDLRTLVAARKRSPLLVADLEALGPVDILGPASEPFRRALQGLLTDAGTDAAHRRAAFLGALYVIEGSTLGGQYIARHVQERLGLSSNAGASYFRGYGEGTGERWREVQAELSAVPDELGDTIIAAARVCFRAFGEALTGVSATFPADGSAKPAQPQDCR